jgi:hypothetical protein
MCLFVNFQVSRHTANMAESGEALWRVPGLMPNASRQMRRLKPLLRVVAVLSSLIALYPSRALGQSSLRTPTLDKYVQFGIPWFVPADSVRPMVSRRGFTLQQRDRFGDLYFQGELYGLPVKLAAFFEGGVLVRWVARADGDTAYFRLLRDKIGLIHGLPTRELRPSDDFDGLLSYWADAPPGDTLSPSRIRLHYQCNRALLFISAPGYSAPLSRWEVSKGKNGTAVGVLEDMSPDWSCRSWSLYRTESNVAVRKGPGRRFPLVQRIPAGTTVWIDRRDWSDSTELDLFGGIARYAGDSEIVGTILGFVDFDEERFAPVRQSAVAPPSFAEMGPCATQARTVYRSRGRAPDRVSHLADEDGTLVSWWYENLRDRSTGRNVILSVDFHWGRLFRGCKVSTYRSDE